LPSSFWAIKPRRSLYGLIFKDKASVFPDVASDDGKTVDIIGTVKLYRGSPEIVLETTGQLSAK
jgi:DNA/RNA endonuclease YhcR with UshA esterase domain